MVHRGSLLLFLVPAHLGKAPSFPKWSHAPTETMLLSWILSLWAATTKWPLVEDLKTHFLSLSEPASVKQTFVLGTGSLKTKQRLVSWMEQVQRGGESSTAPAWTTYVQHMLLWKVHLEETFTLTKARAFLICKPGLNCWSKIVNKRRKKNTGKRSKILSTFQKRTGILLTFKWIDYMDCEILVNCCALYRNESWPSLLKATLPVTGYFWSWRTRYSLD